MERGKLIVFEGLDRTGKSTQCKLLSQALNQSINMRFPNRETITGKQIDSYLQGKQKLPDEVIHLLFSANRWESKQEIIQNLLQGKNIILDRYIYSGVAYSSAKGLDLDWCLNCDKGLPKPDIIFYIELNDDEKNKRNGFGDEIYENIQFQKKVETQYQKIKDESWIVINGDQNQNDIHKQILEIVNKQEIKFQNIQLI